MGLSQLAARDVAAGFQVRSGAALLNIRNVSSAGRRKKNGEKRNIGQKLSYAHTHTHA